jgi:hypothetical protein
MNKIDDCGRFCRYKTLKFRSQYDYNEFLNMKIRTREEFKHLFFKNDLGVFAYDKSRK